MSVRSYAKPFLLGAFMPVAFLASSLGVIGATVYHGSRAFGREMEKKETALPTRVNSGGCGRRSQNKKHSCGRRTASGTPPEENLQPCWQV